MWLSSPTLRYKIDRQDKDRVEATWPYRYGLMAKLRGMEAKIGGGVESKTYFVPCTESEEGKLVCKFSGGRLSNKGVFVTIGMGAGAVISIIGAIVLAHVTAPKKVKVAPPPNVSANQIAELVGGTIHKNTIE